MAAVKRKLSEFSNYLGNADFSRRPGLVRLFLSGLRAVVYAGKKFRYDICFDRAAALSFISIISVIPLGFLFIFFMQAFNLFPYWAEIRDNWIKTTFTEGHQEVLKDLIANFEGDRIGAITAIPYLVLVISALTLSALWLFEASEKTLNRIWGSVRSRSYVQRFTIFWLIVTASPFLLTLSTVLRNRLEANEHIRALMESAVFLETLYGFLVPVAIATLAFFFVYLLLPSARVEVGPALAGAVSAAFLWQLAVVGFRYTVPRAVTFNVYGSLGATAAFLFWFYITWVVILYGGQISYVVQHPRQAVAKLAWRDSSPSLPPGILTVAVAVGIAKAIADGKSPPSLPEFASRWSVGEEALRKEIGSAAPAVFHRSSGEDEVYYLSRDTDKILLRELITPRDFPRQPGLASEEVGELLSMVRNDLDRALSDLTIRDVMNRNLSLRRPDKP